MILPNYRPICKINYGHSFQCVIDCWGAHLDAGIRGAIFLGKWCVIIVLQKVNKQVEAKIKNFKLDNRDERTKKEGNKGTTKTRRSPISAYILVDNCYAWSICNSTSAIQLPQAVLCFTHSDWIYCSVYNTM